MPGISYRAFVRQAVNFASGGGKVVLARGVDVSGYREGTLAIRMHDGSSYTAGTISVKVYREAPTTEDPATDYVEATELVKKDFTSATAGAFFLDLANMGAFLRITAEASSGSNATLILSGDLTLKS